MVQAEMPAGAMMLFVGAGEVRPRTTIAGAQHGRRCTRRSVVRRCCQRYGQHRLLQDPGQAPSWRAPYRGRAGAVDHAAEDTMRDISDHLHNPQVLQAVKDVQPEASAVEVETMRPASRLRSGPIRSSPRRPKAHFAAYG